MFLIAVRLPALSLILLLVIPGVRAADQPRPPSADEMALFREAMKNSRLDTEHWAYTETTTMKMSKGKPPGETVVRFDPSRPYAEQFTPVKVEGKEPTEKQLKNYRRKGEKRGERVARAAEAAKSPGAEPPKLRIGGKRMNLDLEHPLVARVEEGRIVFEVPLQGTRTDIPVDKFQVLVAVGRQNQLVEKVNLLVRESFRVKLVAKIKAGEAQMDFTVVDPKFGPVISSMTGNVGASFLFIPVDATFAALRTDWQRVKSYDERLTVKLGPLQLLDF